MHEIPDMRQLFELEPRLHELEAEVRAVRDAGETPWFCSNFIWMPLAARLKDLVGVARVFRPGDDPGGVLYDGRTFAVAYAYLSPLMPPCRSCGCAGFAPTRQEQLG